MVNLYTVIHEVKKKTHLFRILLKIYFVHNMIVHISVIINGYRMFRWISLQTILK